jgi:hypothetical protein
MLDRAAEHGAAAQRPAEQVRLAEAEVPHHAGHLIAEPLPGERPVSVPGVAVPLQFDGHDLPVAREQLRHGLEYRGRPVPAVHHQQRCPSAAPALPVHVNPVDRGIPAGQLACHGFLQVTSGTDCLLRRSAGIPLIARSADRAEWQAALASLVAGIVVGIRVLVDHPQYLQVELFGIRDGISHQAL